MVNSQHSDQTQANDTLTLSATLSKLVDSQDLTKAQSQHFFEQVLIIY